MCLRFVFLLITRVTARFRLSQREEMWKAAEILILRHQLNVLQRRQPRCPKLDRADRALLATLLGDIPKAASGTAAADYGTQTYVVAVIEHATRRIRILGITLHPTGEWTAQQARNLLMDLDEQADRVKLMIRDRGSNFTAAFDAILANVCPIRVGLHLLAGQRSTSGLSTGRWRRPGRRVRTQRGHNSPDRAGGLQTACSG